MGDSSLQKNSSKSEGMMELEKRNHRFATFTESIDLGKDHQCMKPQNER